MWSAITTLIALPILAVISIPLILSAWVTISFAVFALVLRLSVIYVELVYGFLVHFLSLQTSTSSLLTFVASEAPTPANRSRRNSNHGTQRKNDSLSSWAGPTYTKSRKNSYARSMIEAHLSPSPSPLYNFPVSGDERRDFEGVGGWRSYPSKARPNEKATWTSSSSSISDVDQNVDADERAWLSLNHRLELPSQLITLSTSTYAGSTLHSPLHEDARNGRTFQSVLGAKDLSNHESRHHHRSLTTSSLTTSDRRTGTGLSLALSTRPDNAPTSRDYISMSSSTPRLPPFMTPQPHEQPYSQARVARGVQNGAPFTSSYLSGPGELAHSFGSNSSGSLDRNGGYFSLRRPGSSGSHVSGRASPIASGYTTPGAGVTSEERDASLSLSRVMAHYPTSPRHRRQSVGSTRGLVGERMG